MSSAPWLLIDVDGVINVDVSNSVAKKTGLRTVSARARDGWRYKITYDPEVHTWFRELSDAGLRLAWCTTWQDEANSLLPDKLGLPELPVVTFDKHREGTKVPGIARFLSGEELDAPFAWIDDEIGNDDRVLLRRYELKQDYLLVGTDPRVGMTAEHVQQIIG